jgi:hypothetical protein
MREGQTPQTAEEFYIRPHGEIFDVYKYTSNVRFWFRVGKRDSEEKIAFSFEFSPADSAYYKKENISLGTEDDRNYFEIKKLNGSSAAKKTTLAIKAFNRTKTADEENPVYFPCYYVNEEKFTEGDGFVINFRDYVTAEEEAQVIIPKHEVAETQVRTVIAPLPNVSRGPVCGVYHDIILPLVSAALATP